MRAGTSKVDVMAWQHDDRGLADTCNGKCQDSSGLTLTLDFFMEYWRHVRGFLGAYLDTQKAECGHMAYRSHASFLWNQFPVEWTL